MALRTSSLPPALGSNPFWSEKTRDEWVVRYHRPSDLPPVPGGDDGDLDEESQALQDQGVEGREGRPKRRHLSRDGGRAVGVEQFSTPASWEETSKLSEKVAVKTEGRMPSDDGRHQRYDDDLQRSLEKELLAQLHEENVRLKQELERHKERSSRSSWSAVSPVESAVPAAPTSTPPRSRTPTRRENGKDDSRYTPQGTRVPAGPPPAESLPELPVWPFEKMTYEVCEDEDPCHRRLGPKFVSRPVGLVNDLYGEEVERGMDSRMMSHNGPRGGSYSRHAEGQVDNVLRGGVNPRYGGGRRDLPVEDEVLSGAAARAVWLERELQSLKRVLESDCRQREPGLTGSYWQVPFTRNSSWLAEERRDGQVRGDRAWGNHGQVRDDRACGNHGQVRDDRAWGIQGQVRGDRAWGNSERVQEDRACSTRGEVRGDRARSNSAGVREDRAFSMRDGDHGELTEQRMAQEQNSVKKDMGNVSGQRNKGEGEPSSGTQLRDRQAAVGSEFSGGGLKLELPSLPTATTPMDLGDWLILIGPIMRDLSQHATVWWERTLEAANQHYEVWRTASPLQRVQLQVALPLDLAREPFIRTEQRGVGLLLRAVPEELKKVLISNRDVSSTAILWRLLTTFQPGGAGEKAHLLKSLTMLSPGTTSMDIAMALRQWRRCFQRAREIGASLPDGTLLVYALEAGAAMLGRLDGQSAFRVASARSELRVDEQPTQDNVWAYSQVLLAEAETLQLASAVTGSGGNKPQVQQLTASPGKSNPPVPSGGTCRFWGSEGGCKHGKGCKFAHPALPDSKERCWLCSAMGHRKQDCPAKGGKGEQLDPPVGGSGGGGSGYKGTGKSKSKDKGKQGEEKSEGGKSGAATKAATSTTPATTTPAASSTEDKGTGEGGKDLQTSTGQSGGSGDALLGEVAGLLRSLRLQAPEQPTMKVLQVKKLAGGAPTSCLLDGGATHCMRQCRDQEEWDAGSEVSVALAQGNVTMKQNAQGTLLALDCVQPIVPLSKLTALGYKVNWDDVECSVSHPGHGKLEINMEQGCPTVPVQVGWRLMNEVETQLAMVKKVRAVLESGRGDGSQEQQRWQCLRELFPEAPLDILEQIPGNAQWKSENLPFNRRTRRKLERAKMVVVHTFCGKDDGFWRKLETADVAVLPLDLTNGYNLLEADLGGFLESLAMSGRVELWLSGPPCRSVSVARLRHAEDDGPRPVRSREGVNRYGLPGLSGAEEALVRGDSILWLKNLWWIWLASKCRPPQERPFQALVEQPRDPAEWKEGGEECPSFTIWDETRRVMEEVNLVKIDVQQGDLGHVTAKPTSLLTSIPELQYLQEYGQKAGGGKQAWPTTLEERLAFSKDLAAWAPGLKQALAAVIRERSKDAGSMMKRLSKKDKESIAGWQAHFDHGHIPFRNDCTVCLEGAGKDRQRRRLECRTSYCLSVDICGPFQEGWDQATGPSPRYFLVGNVSVPVNSEGPMVQGLKDLGFRKMPAQFPKNDEKKEVEETAIEPEEEDPMAIQEQEQNPGEEQPQVEVKVREEDERKWKEFIAGSPAVESKVLSFAVPLVSRKDQHMVAAVASIFARVRSMQVPVLRVHTDRAREFAGAMFRKWCLDRSLWHTMSPGDEPTQNARVERTIGLLKNQVRTMIKATKAPIHWWPLALRQASEQLLRAQLWEVGIATPQLPAFGARAVARSKTWHQRSSPWKFPGSKVRIWGPAYDMSITSGGVFIQDEEGRWMRSTVVRPVMDPEVDEEGKVIPVTDSSNGGVDSTSGSGVPKNRCGGSSPVTLEAVDTDPKLAVESPEPEDFWDEDAPEERLPQPLPKCAPGTQGECWEVQQLDGKQESTLGGAELSQRLRYRLHGKQVGPAISEAPALYALRAGGEEDRSLLTNTDEEMDFEWIEGLKLVQHQQLQALMREEASRLQQGQFVVEEAKVLKELGDSIHNLEQELAVLRMRKQEDKAVKSLQLTDNGEVLQTQTVSLEVVRKEIEEWIPAFKQEVDTILESGAMERITDQRYKQLLQEHPDLERLPMLAVATIKPPCKRKGRVVVCGNCSTKERKEDEPDPSVGGVDTVAIRCLLDLAVQRELQVGSIDVKGAFLQAPRRSVKIRPTICDPPQLLKQMKLVEPSEKWLVHKALYGFAESPSDWSCYRDATMEKLIWKSGEIQLCLQRTPERHVWRISAVGDSSCDFGYIAVYVDDLLFAVEENHLGGLLDALQGAWKCSPPELVSLKEDMRFCGFELRAVPNGGLRISQAGFAREVLRRRGINGTEAFPLNPIPEDDDESPLDLSAVKEAQGLVGELTWLTTRSRPDLSYSVGVASRLIHRRPKAVVKMCEHILRYVNATVDEALVYRLCSEGDVGTEEELQFLRSPHRLQIFSDASYGAAHERFKSVSGVAIERGRNLIAWDSQAQPFIAQSTAEAEVISYNSAYQIGESVSAFCGALNVKTTKHLYGDSKAGISVVASDCGPWRTRHLRIRAHKIREAVQTIDTPWTIRHLSGALLIADGFTKVLTHQAFSKFKARLRMESGNQLPERSLKSVAVEAAKSAVGWIDPVAVLACVGSLLCLVGVRNLGTLIVACAALANGRKGRRPSRFETRPQKRATKKDESPNHQEERSGSGTANDVGNGTEKNQSDQLRRVVAGLKPGIRAFRVLPRGSHGKDEEEEASARPKASSTAAARGRDAMAAVTSQMEALRVDVDVTVKVTGGDLRRGDLRGDDRHEERLKGDHKKKASTEGYVAASSMTPQEQWEDTVLEGGPWNQYIFSEPPKGADAWMMNHVKEGWLLRKHGSKGRVYPFHPLHKSCPVSAEDMTGMRVTIVYGPSGGQETLVDSWKQPRTWQRPGPWRGYTFFELQSKKEKAKASVGGSKASGSSTGSADASHRMPRNPSDDESYILVNEDEEEF